MLGLKQQIILSFVFSSVFAGIRKPEALSQFIPKVRGPGESIEVKRGDTIRLKCTIDYNPNWDFALMWRKSDSLLITNTLIFKAPNERTSVYNDGLDLQIVNAQPEDSGEYNCSVTTTPQINQTHYVKVQYMGSISLYPNGQVEVTAGEKLTLRCFGDGYPKPMAAWFLNDGPVLDAKTVLDTGELIVETVSMEHTGIYKCDLGNGVEDSKSASVEVKVKVDPTIVVTTPSSQPAMKSAQIAAILTIVILVIFFF